MNGALFGGMLIFSIVLLYLYIWQRKWFLQRQNQQAKQLLGLQNELQAVKNTLTREQQALYSAHEKAQLQPLTQLIVSQMEQGVICIDQKLVIRLINEYAGKLLEFSATTGVLYSQHIHIRNIGDKDDQAIFTDALNGIPYVLPEGATLVTSRGSFPISGKITRLGTGMVALIFVDNTSQSSWIKEQQAFFSAAAHELRTPLTVIRLTVALLLEKYDTLSREKITEHLRRADETAGHLVKLVNDFLNISRIDQGRLEVKIESINIIRIVDEVIAELSLLAKEKKLYIQHEPISADLANVSGDSVRVKEILTNLISNCIKYTHQGGITISHEIQNSRLATNIADTGIGIPVESQGLLFKRFVQVGEARKQSVGKSTGLGLYIAKKIAQLMHGDIVLERSEPGIGSTFSLLLPLH